MAQMLGTVSTAMFDEFEIRYTSGICERFGLVYYGCRDALDKKMNEVRKLPNVRKVSMSPWADHENGAAEKTFSTSIVHALPFSAIRQSPREQKVEERRVKNSTT